MNFNWYWAELPKRNPAIISSLIYVDDVERPIGFVAFGQHFQDRQLKIAIPGNFELYHMVIDSVFQGCGLGRASTIHVLREMTKNHACEKLLVACYPENKTATQLYRNLGFVELGRNYDDDPLYSLDPGEFHHREIKFSTLPKGSVVDEGMESWSKESQKSMREFDWAAWDLGLER